MQKYKLLEDEFIVYKEKKLYRIEALVDFGGVIEGDKGGFVESEANLSHENNCWIYNDCLVCDDAIVKDNAEIFGSVKVCDKAMVYDNATLFDSVIVKDNAKVYGYAEVCGNAIIQFNAEVKEHESISNEVIGSIIPIHEDKKTIEKEVQVVNKEVSKQIENVEPVVEVDKNVNEKRVKKTNILKTIKPENKPIHTSKIPGEKIKAKDIKEEKKELILPGNIISYNNKIFYVEKVESDIIETYKISDSILDLMKAHNAMELSNEDINIKLYDGILMLDTVYYIKNEFVKRVSTVKSDLMKRISDTVEFLKNQNLIKIKDLK